MPYSSHHIFSKKIQNLAGGEGEGKRRISFPKWTNTKNLGNEWNEDRYYVNYWGGILIVGSSWLAVVTKTRIYFECLFGKRGGEAQHNLRSRCWLAPCANITRLLFCGELGYFDGLARLKYVVLGAGRASLLRGRGIFSLWTRNHKDFRSTSFPFHVFFLLLREIAVEETWASNPCFFVLCHALAAEGGSSISTNSLLRGTWRNTMKTSYEEPRWGLRSSSNIASAIIIIINRNNSSNGATAPLATTNDVPLTTHRKKDTKLPRFF